MSQLYNPAIEQMAKEIAIAGDKPPVPTDSDLGWQTANAVRRRREWRYYKRPTAMQRAFENALKGGR